MTENDRIKQIRSSLGLTLEAFGARIGVTKNAISNIECGRRGVTDQMRTSICREFNVNEHWLRTGEGEPRVELSRNEELTAFFGRVMGSKTESFKREFLRAWSRLTPDQWDAVEKFCRELAAMSLDDKEEGAD